uniref:Uncharacterized protein n=1 Tax=Opuntia streptacantha TaxID=393608 RepID=A0A7C9CHR3_OPUST
MMHWLELKFSLKWIYTCFRLENRSSTTRIKSRNEKVPNQLNLNAQSETPTITGESKHREQNLNHQTTRSRDMRISIDKGEMTTEERIRARITRQRQARSKQQAEIDDGAIVKVRGLLMIEQLRRTD